MDSTNRKIRTCPYGFHVNNEDSECTCGTKSTNEEKKTTEEKFREIGAGSVRFIATRQEVIVFINQELQSLVAEILEKKMEVTIENGEYVSVENILQIARKRGIELSK